MLSLLYSTALFLSNSAEAPRAPAYAPSFCRRTDCNCSPYRTASTQQNTLARRPLRMFLPSDTPAANRSLIYVITCHNTHTESRFLFTPPRRLQPPSRTHGFYLANHYRPGSCALCCPPLRRSQPLSYLRSHLSTPTRRVSVSLRADARPLSRPPLRRSQLLSYRHAHLSTPTRRVSVSLRAAASPLFCPPLCRLHSLSYLCPHLSQHALILVSSSRRCAD